MSNDRPGWGAMLFLLLLVCGLFVMGLVGERRIRTHEQRITTLQAQVDSLVVVIDSLTAVR